MSRFSVRPGLVFAVVCAGFVAGVGCGALPRLTWWGVPWWGVLVAGVVGCAVLWRRKFFRCGVGEGGIFVLMFCCACVFGMWRYQAIQPTADSVFAIADGKVHSLEGTILRTEESDKGMRFTLDDVFVDDEPREDRVLVRASLFSQNVVGERVSILCPLERPEPFDDFAYDRFLAAKDIVAVCSSRSLPFVLGVDPHPWIRFLAAIDEAHRFVVRAIDVVFPDSHAQLLAGLLVGDNAFSDTWHTRFLRTGTSHIVAASGSNVALVVSLVLSLLFGMGIHRRYATFLALGGIGTFVLLAGGESAVLRAGIMASLLVFARFIGRASSVRNVLLFTVCLMLFHEPRILRDDVGFQLSVLSTLGLLFWAKPFAKKMVFIPEAWGIREGFATTLAATIATLPVTAFGMGQVSFAGPIANLLVLPLLPLAMASGAVATVVGMILPIAGRILALPAWWILDTVLMILRELSALPFVYIKTNGWMLFGGLIVSAVLWTGARAVFRHAGHPPSPRLRLGRPTGIHRMMNLISSKKDTSTTVHTKSSLLVPFLFSLLFLLSFSQHVFRDGWFSSAVRVWVFDIGQGDGIFIDTPDKDVIIDGGPSFIFREKVGSVLPWFDRNIEHVFATHPHADHIAGLIPILEQYSANVVGRSDQGCSSLECIAFARATPTTSVVHAGDMFELSPGVTLRTVWPEGSYNGKKISDPNDGSLVFLLETTYGSMLFTGDAGIEEEQIFLASLPSHVDVLKVGHHGSRTATSEELLEALRPGYGIISLGEGNSFKHPHGEVIERLQKHGVEIYRTDLLGDICVIFGKEGVHVESSHL